jgi:hypothetical protein
MWDGVPLHQAKGYGWRDGDPATDLDLHGHPVEKNYVVIVRVKDCPTHVEQRGSPPRDWTIYEPKGVKQALRLAYGGTNYGYGADRTHNSPRRFRMDGGEVLAAVWYSCPMYVVLDGDVYVGTIRRATKRVG